jgi:hypothetical protein
MVYCIAYYLELHNAIAAVFLLLCQNLPTKSQTIKIRIKTIMLSIKTQKINIFWAHSPIWFLSNACVFGVRRS